MAQQAPDELTIKKAQTIIEKVLGDENQADEDPYRNQDQAQEAEEEP